jgi:hypothetical protein
LLHEVIVSCALDLEMGGRAEFHCLDEIVSHVGVDARLPEGIQGRARRAAADQPGEMHEPHHVRMMSALDKASPVGFGGSLSPDSLGARRMLCPKTWWCAEKAGPNKGATQ